MKRPITIFYVYADTDEALRQQLEKHLALLRRQKVIAGWEPILAGTPWAEKIEQIFNEATLILLLISSDFLDSDVCYEQQMQRALERERNGEVKVIPILLRPVDGNNAPFIHLRALPANGKPITSWLNQDEAFKEVVEGIRYVIEGVPISQSFSPQERSKYNRVDTSQPPRRIAIMVVSIFLLVSLIVATFLIASHYPHSSPNPSDQGKVSIRATATSNIPASTAAISPTSPENGTVPMGTATIVNIPTSVAPNPVLNDPTYPFDNTSQIDSWTTSGVATNQSQVSWDKTVGHNGSKGSLKVNTQLWGNLRAGRPSSDDATHTEIATYFNASDFSGKHASCWIHVPSHVSQTPPKNEDGYISLFVKSDNAIQYGGKAYINDHYDGKWFQLSLPIGVLDPNDPASQLDTHFNATHVTAIGVNIQAQENSSFPQEQVEIYLDDCSITA